MATYYISESSGNDNNNGSIDSPWKTLGKLSSAGIQAGDTVYLKRGDTWSAVLNVPASGTDDNNRITFDAYGEGALPIITVVYFITNANNPSSWQDMGSNIWRLSLDHDPRRIWVDDVEWQRAQNVESITSQVRWAFSSNYLYVYNSGNPSNMVFKEAGTQVKAFSFGSRDYITVQNLEIRGGRSCTVECYGDYNIIQNCIIRDSGLMGILAHGDGRPDYNSRNGIIRNCIIDSRYIFNDSYENLNANSDGIRLNYGCWYWEVYGNVIKNFGHTGIYLTGAGGNPSGYKNTGNLIFENIITAPDLSYARGISTDGADGECENNYIYNNYIVNCPVRNQINGNNNYVFNNIIENVSGASFRTDETAQGISMEGNSPYTSCHDNFISSNVIMNCSGPGIQIWGYTGAADKLDNIIYNNKLINCGINPKEETVKNVALYIDSHSSVLSQYFLKNNFFNTSLEDPLIFYRGSLIGINGFNEQTSDVIRFNSICVDMQETNSLIYEILRSFKKYENYETKFQPLFSQNVLDIISRIENPTEPYNINGKIIINIIFDDNLNTNPIESGTQIIWDTVLSYFDRSDRYAILLNGQFPYISLYLSKKNNNEWKNVFIQEDFDDFEIYRDSAILNIGFQNSALESLISQEKTVLMFGKYFSALVSGLDYKGILYNQYIYNWIQVYQYPYNNNYLFTAYTLQKKNDSMFDVYERIRMVLNHLY